MAKITYIEANGAEHSVEVASDLSVMEGARNNGIPGILADCGGTCACATCRVFVDPAWQALAGEPTSNEEATIEAFADPVPGMRLSCQVRVTPALDGLVVRIPESQF